ncbi:MAG: hypothetical protein ACTSVD_02885, partial [Candidatus Thorarchaeota archaeon]
MVDARGATPPGTRIVLLFGGRMLSVARGTRNEVATPAAMRGGVCVVKKLLHRAGGRGRDSENDPQPHP